MTPTPRTKTPKPEVTEADLSAAETTWRESTATFNRLRRKTDLTASDVAELRRANSALQKAVRLFGRAVREHGKRRGDC